MPHTKILPLNRFNWTEFIEIEILESQRDFTPSVLYSLAEANFENLFPYGILYEEKPVGFLMYGDFSGIFWINRILIDAKFQGKGIAKQALNLLLDELKKHPNCKEIRTSYAVENKAAAALFAQANFQPSEPIEGEIVAKWQGK